MKGVVLLLSFSLPFFVFGQSYIKLNPARAALGEVQLMYEKPLAKENHVVEYKFGIVYPNQFNIYSSINSGYGLFEHYYGLSTGVVLGASRIKYSRKKSNNFIQYGMDIRLLRMNDVQIITGLINTSNPYYVIVDGNHLSLNPAFKVGKRDAGKLMMGVYIGLGASLRFSKISKVEDCDYRSRPCNKSGTYITSPNGGPTVHLGMLFGLRTKKAKASSL